jgi:hypothetical protein
VTGSTQTTLTVFSNVEHPSSLSTAPPVLAMLTSAGSAEVAADRRVPNPTTIDHPLAKGSRVGRGSCTPSHNLKPLRQCQSQLASPKNRFRATTSKKPLPRLALLTLSRQIGDLHPCAFTPGRVKTRCACEIEGNASGIAHGLCPRECGDQLDALSWDARLPWCRPL